MVLQRLILIIWGLISTFSANAQEDNIQKRIAQCSTVESDLERLECYDNLSKDMGFVDVPEIIESEGVGKWNVNVDRNPLDDSKTVVLVLEADEGKSRWGQPVGLVLRCKSNKTEVFIVWNDYLGSKAFVTTRIGSEQAKKQEWSLSTNSKATFYSGNDITFIRKLLAADKFVAQVTPYNESPITAVFDVRGLSEAIKPLQDACGWE